jgi:hypothetical protein
MHTTVLSEQARIRHNSDGSGPVLLCVPQAWIESGGGGADSSNVVFEIPEAVMAKLVERMLALKKVGTDPFETLDPFNDARLANLVRGEPGKAPGSSLTEAVLALRDLEEREREDERSFRLRPDPRLIAATVVCRDYAGCDPLDIDPILTLNDPDDPDKVKVLCVLSVTKEAYAALPAGEEG